MPRTRTARFEPRLRPVASEGAPLGYATRPPGAPPFPRSASGLAWLDDRLVVVQDDASFLALVHPTSPGEALALPLPLAPGDLPAYSESEGTKAKKPDFEALAWLGDTLAAFGSGSRPERERVALVPRADLLTAARTSPPSGTGVRVVQAAALYASLRAEPAFSGAELNVEGATPRGDHLLLFNRGNGAHRGARGPVNASAAVSLAGLVACLSAPPGPGLLPLEDVTQWDLGEVEGVTLTFTDVAATPRGELVWLAAAEASPNAYDDGEVVGVALGMDDGADARWSLLRDRAGRPLREKAEGLVLDPSGARAGWLVTDPDNPDRPARLHRVEW